MQYTCRFWNNEPPKKVTMKQLRALFYYDRPENDYAVYSGMRVGP